MSNLERAKALFQSGDYTCVLCKEDTVHTSALIGVSPMMEFIASGVDLNGFSAADKIVGKAAAMLFVLAGVREAHGGVMSEDAVRIFQKHGVLYSFDLLIPKILNRAMSGLCPMEQAVQDIDDPATALEAIKLTLEQMKKNNMKRLQPENV